MRSLVHVGINIVIVSEDCILGSWHRVVWEKCTDISEEFSAYKIRDPATICFLSLLLPQDVMSQQCLERLFREL